MLTSGISSTTPRSELEIIFALLKLQDRDSELAHLKKRLGTAFVAPTHEAWGGGGVDMGSTFRGRNRRRALEQQPRRFNMFRQHHCPRLQEALMKLTTKVMGLYVLKNRNMYK